MTEPRRGVFVPLLQLALPIIGLNVLNVLALVIDTAMVGALPDAETALSGLGFSVQLVFLLMVGMIGLSIGTVALGSRAHGASDTERTNHILQQSIQLALVLSLVVALVGNLLAEPALYALGARGDVLRLGVDYLRPLLTFTVFNYLNILFGGIHRGVGNTVFPFLVALVASVVNVGLNYGLILGNYGLPALGVQGAALGTVLSHVVAVSLYVVASRFGVSGLIPRLRLVALDRGLCGSLLAIGFPAALDMVVLNAGLLVIIGLLGALDELAVGAHGVGLRVQALAFVPGLAVAQATGAMVGQALGRGRVDEARRVLWASIALCVGIMTVLAAILWVGAHPIVELFGMERSSPMHAYTVQWMRVLGGGMPIVGVWIGCVGLFQGAGATRTSLAINAAATLVIQIPLSWLLGFAFGLGPLGVWLAFPLSFVVKALLGGVAVHRGRWAVTGLTARG